MTRVRYGEVPLAEADGTLLAHSIRAGATSFKKGRRLGSHDLERLAEAGVARVAVVRLDDTDVHEDEAAARVARALRAQGLGAAEPFTGRVNLFAAKPGLLTVERDLIDRINRVHPAITVATLAPFSRVEAGVMVATIKIIPFAAPLEAIEAIERLTAEAPGPAIAAHPFHALRVALIQTRSSATTEKTLDKTERITEARLAALGGGLAWRARCPHDAEALAATIREARTKGCDLILVNGASAITDLRDVIPVAIERAGGRVLHFGMPVDPGNLMFLGDLRGRPVLGLPGSSRSPALSGADWVLERLICGVPVGPAEITAMGVGGLLKEIPTRPRPRLQRG